MLAISLNHLISGAHKQLQQQQSKSSAGLAFYGKLSWLTFLWHEVL